MRLFCGKPMIAWSIEAALQSAIFDAVVVSTDDDEIAILAEALGAEVPFRRPPELSDDHTATMPVVAHGVRWWEANMGILQYCCCIYATAPFVQTAHLRGGFDLLRQKNDADFVFTVTSYAYPIFRALEITKQGRIRMLWPDNEIKRSQDLPEVWHDAGQFYWGRRDAFLNQKVLFSAKSYPLVLPRHLVQDIDTPEDWERAEKMFSAIA
jgi:pseudaminic acid cytidylyltransferase